MSPEVRRVLDKLDAVKATAGGWMARCPAHADGRPSLKVDLADDGRVLLKCYAGCETAAIVEAIGLELGDLFPPRKGEHRARGRCVERTAYEVCDEHGALYGTHICEVFESGEKACTWQGPNGSNRLGRPLAAMPLYGIDDLNGSPAVVVTEGEKARDALRVRKIAAVGTVTGASSVPGPDALRPILGRDVVLWADRDAAGAAHMAKIAVALKELGQPAASIRRVVWDDAPPGGDAADWTGDRAGLLALLEAAAPRPFSSNGKHDTEETAPTDESDPIHMSDLGNARRLVALHGADIRFCYERDAWLVWDESRWSADAPEAIEQRAKDVPRQLLSELSALSGKARDVAYKFMVQSEQAARIAASITLARSEPNIPVRIDQLDADPWLLNVRNGTIDLRTGTIRPHDRADLISKMAPVDFDPDATSQLWDNFLRKMLHDDEAMIGYLRRLSGYTLTGDTSAQILAFVHGPGASGKTTFTDALGRMLGPAYAMAVQFDLFLSQVHGSAEGPTPILASLVGARMVMSVESEQDRKLAVALVKQMTGGDQIRARVPYARRSFQYRPSFKLFFVSNHEPRLPDDDDAAWRRIHTLPFTAALSEEERDDTVKDRLIGDNEHRRAILAWAVRGCLEWQAKGGGIRGLDAPKAVTEATDRYRKEMDPVGRFIDDECDVDDSQASESSHVLWNAFEEYAKKKREHVTITREEFWRRLGRRGFESKKSTGGVMKRQGIRLSGKMAQASYEATYDND